MIKGRAELLDEGTLRTRLRTTGVQPWRNRLPKPEWVVIRPDTVSGRRL